MMKRLRGLFLVSLALVALATACGSDDVGDCLSICNEAQDLSCTSIDDCGGFCVSGLELANKGGCDAQFNAYESCAESNPVCSIDAQCGSQQNALATCIATYCLANSTDPDCTTFQQSF